MSLSKDEQKQIIKELKEYTDVAEYAFKDALKKKTLSEEELLFLKANIEIISVLKPVIKANRNGQKKYSRKKNDEYREKAQQLEQENISLEQENISLKQRIDILVNKLFDLEKSEIYQLGKWLKEALLKVGEEKDKSLREKGLVHKDYYNNTLKKVEEVFIIKEKEDKKTEEEYINIVKNFEDRIDFLREINKKAEQYIIENHGKDIWDDLIG